MEKIKRFSQLALLAAVLTSCGGSKGVVYMEQFSPEESGLNLVKITDEANGSVIAGATGPLNSNVQYSLAQCGVNQEHNIRWTCYPNLQLSPDGTKLAYIARNNKQDNIMVRNTNSQGISTQRTFRNINGGIYWGNDDKLYFADNNHPNYFICSVDANQGSVMQQLTSGNVNDAFPVLSPDANKVYFTRWTSSYGPSIWALNRSDGTISSCSRGFGACPIPGDNNAYYCVRNNTSGRSEIWYVDYVNGRESVIVSDVNHSFTSPALSPDGKWLLLVGNATSQISKKENTDIFVVRTDGTQLTQLTYHPCADMCPVWSKDGRQIYFISSRANKEQYYNIWKMNFNL